MRVLNVWIGIFQMSEIEFDPRFAGVPLKNFALHQFNRTALSPSRHGVLNLLNQMHRLVTGG
jgi:hypothetical protein